ncbi:MAG: C40 family peptidase [Alcaligenaceae bacterium]|nr:C40 family peptidase [Alcaligenaceae bacterium]
MSAQPPHHRKACLPPAFSLPLRLLTATACLVLAGCATQGGAQQAANQHEGEGSFLVDKRSVRNQYLANVSADPLGAYLSAGDQDTEARNLASTALNYLGINYRFGGNSPAQGFDCSGLVRYAAEKSLGLKLPRRSSEMARLGESIKRNELESGDLVFFNTRGQRFSHVGIYVGDGKFVHAPRTGSKVRVESMNVGYWQKRYNGARRLPSETENFASAADIRKLASK